jgi:hypothetical protein
MNPAVEINKAEIGQDIPSRAHYWRSLTLREGDSMPVKHSIAPVCIKPLQRKPLGFSEIHLAHSATILAELAARLI